MEKIKTAEEILDKHYPPERTVYRENILKAMNEYCMVCLRDYQESILEVINESITKEKNKNVSNLLGLSDDEYPEPHM